MCFFFTCLSFFSSTCPTTAKSPCEGKAREKKKTYSRHEDKWQRDVASHAQTLQRGAFGFSSRKQWNGAWQDLLSTVLQKQNGHGEARHFFPFQVVFLQIAMGTFKVYTYIMQREGSIIHAFGYQCADAWTEKKRGEQGHLRRTQEYAPSTFFWNNTLSGLRQCPVWASVLKRCPFATQKLYDFQLKSKAADGMKQWASQVQRGESLRQTAQRCGVKLSARHCKRMPSLIYLPSTALLLLLLSTV